MARTVLEVAFLSGIGNISNQRHLAEAFERDRPSVLVHAVA
jgi:hypothetical protein